MRRVFVIDMEGLAQFSDPQVMSLAALQQRLHRWRPADGERRSWALPDTVSAVAERRSGAGRLILTSPLRRAAEVGRWLRRWGWQHRVDARLSEADFGRWDGRRWADIQTADMAGWTDNFVAFRPGGGESVQMLRQRVRALNAGGAGAWSDVRRGNWA